MYVLPILPSVDLNLFSDISRGLQVMNDSATLNVPVPLRHCKVIFLWPLVASQCMLTSVEMVLINRGERPWMFAHP